MGWTAGFESPSNLHPQIQTIEDPIHSMLEHKDAKRIDGKTLHSDLQ
jgi:hypothetical protein